MAELPKTLIVSWVLSLEASRNWIARPKILVVAISLSEKQQKHNMLCCYDTMIHAGALLLKLVALAGSGSWIISPNYPSLQPVQQKGFESRCGFSRPAYESCFLNSSHPSHSCEASLRICWAHFVQSWMWRVWWARRTTNDRQVSGMAT